MIKTVDDLIRELQEIKDQTDDYDMGSLPVDVRCEDIIRVEVMNNSEGHPRCVRITA